MKVILLDENQKIDKDKMSEILKAINKAKLEKACAEDVKEACLDFDEDKIDYSNLDTSTEEDYEGDGDDYYRTAYDHTYDSVCSQFEDYVNNYEWDGDCHFSDYIFDVLKDLYGEDEASDLIDDVIEDLTKHYGFKNMDDLIRDYGDKGWTDKHIDSVFKEVKYQLS